MSLDRSKLKFCQNQGTLVGGDHWIPDSISDCNLYGRFQYIGCNQVFCSSCQQDVRQRTGYKIENYSRYDQEKQARALYGTENWDEIEFLKPDKAWSQRIYYCACHFFPESGSTALDGTDDHLIYGGQQPECWKCNGHPPLTFPAEFYGLTLKQPSDTAKIVEAIVKHKVKLNNPLPEEEFNPESFLISRLYYNLEEGPYRDAIDNLLTDFLTHKVVLHRSVALLHIEKFPASSVGTKLVEVYRTSPMRFNGVKHPHHARAKTRWEISQHAGLGEQFQSALLHYLVFSKEKAGQELAREMILKNKLKLYWGSSVSGIGLDWIEENFREIYVLAPKENLASLIRAIKEKEPVDILLKINELDALKLLADDDFKANIRYDLREKLKDLLNPYTHEPVGRKKKGSSKGSGGK